jgi:hypothetical protein
VTVDGRGVERPRDGHRVFDYSHFGLVAKTWLNWRPSGTIRGKVETAGWKGRGVDMWQASTSKVVAPT